MSSSGNTGFYGSNSRPTGNYYSTSTGSTSSSYPAYNAYGSNNASGSDNTQQMDDAQEDWFSSTQSPTPAAPTIMNPYANTSSSTSVNQQEHAGTQGIRTASAGAAGSGSDLYGAGGTSAGGLYGTAPSPSSGPTSIPNRTESMELLSGPINSGPMDSGGMSSKSTTTTSTTAIPSAPTSGNYSAPYNPAEFANEPPLMEELGINIDHIRTKSLAVLLPMKYAKANIDTSIMEDADMAGPLVFALLLGGELLLAGKIHFGYIYGFGLFGCLSTCLVINLMSPSDAISVWTVTSILGYSLLPVNALAALNVFIRIRNMGDIGMCLAALVIAWCTISSTRLFERGCGLREQRFLVGYPNALLYSAFVMITIF